MGRSIPLLIFIAFALVEVHVQHAVPHGLAIQRRIVQRTCHQVLAQNIRAGVHHVFGNALGLNVLLGAPAG